MRYTIRYLFVPAVALLITISLYNWIARNFLEPQNGVTSTGEALIGGPFTLTNQDGKEISDSDFSDKLMLVYFGFTHCPSICPTDMAVLSEALKNLGDDAKKIQPVFITIDPERDTPEQIKKFLANFYPGFEGLTGTKEQIASVTAAYRVYSQKVDAEKLGEYLMDHSSFTYLMGRDGKYITHFTSQQSASEIVEGIKKNL
jgi:protein SCO1/2